MIYGNGESPNVAVGTEAEARGHPHGGSRRITVVIGVLDELVSRGLAHMLREDDPGLELLATEVEDYALDGLLERYAPRVVVLAEPSIHGPVLERLARAHPATAIVAVMSRDAPRAVGLRLLSAGVSCISIDTSSEDILTTIRAAAERRPVAVTSSFRLDARDPPNIAALTPREVEVLEFLASGMTYDEIAGLLHLSAETVRTHSASIRRKLHVRTKRELIGVIVPNPSARQVRDHQARA